ncbi:MAG: hypothetical protein K8R85_08065 [Bacteroidetes bacterium]|nr:hypothetical protein [Bacteroidota bacterium]
MNTDSNKVTNLDYLAELSKGSMQFVNEMIEIFLVESPLELSLLEKGILEKNFDLVRASAHKMRSTIPFVGIDKIIMAEMIEMERLAAIRSDFPQIELLFVKVKDVYLKAIEELKQ